VVETHPGATEEVFRTEPGLYGSVDSAWVASRYYCISIFTLTRIQTLLFLLNLHRDAVQRLRCIARSSYIYIYIYHFALCYSFFNVYV